MSGGHVEGIEDVEAAERAATAEVARVEAAGRRVAWPIAGGGRMAWRVWGEGRPLVLLHGGHGSWTHWLRNVEALAARRQVWAPDLPAFGESDALPGVRDADGLWETVGDAIAALVGDSPVDLVGFSFGSMVAGFLAANRPSRVRSLTLVGAPALGLRHAPVPGLVSVRGRSDPIDVRAAHRHNLRVLMLANDALVDALALHVQALNVVRDRLPRRQLAHGDLLRRLQTAWRCPVHGIWGECDALYADGLIDRIAGALDGCDLRALQFVAGAGHWVQFERSEAFNALLLALLDRLE
jgi:2-hydroxy-6-oxonona-2,4-dienedioate hydrolase